ncbi:MAG: AMP-binding protein [Candidatus Lokiarchaeota archaeon]|nr:AMP-binding protein [Candidatus Lokiarchaeota archaeon]MBD3343219.1 AMP-binding protein [Candidatus Lokiarchaeota archaeon]
MSVYEEKFWKKNWDSHVEDLDPKEFETSFIDALRPIFKKYPEKMVFGYLGVEFTFKDLDNYSNQFANMLIENGFSKGDVVGINVPNTPEYVIAIVGAMKVGCLISGVSPLLSAIQIEYQLNDLGSGGKKVCLVTLDAIFAGHIVKIHQKISQLKVIVTTSVGGFLPKIKQVLGKLIGKIPKGKVTPLPGKKVIDFHKELIKEYSSQEPKVEVTADDVAFIQYTGGTTGPPKGAVLSHRNIVSDIVIFQRWLNWEQGKGLFLSGFPFFHIAGVFTLLNGLYLGWSQILIPNPRDTDHIIKEILKYEPTVLANVPTLYQMLLKNPKFKEIDKDMLDVIISAAAPFPKESQEILESVVGEGKLMELYGMTETSPLSSGNPANGEKKLGSVGLPFPNTDFKIVDPNTGEPVPLNEAGEICVRGPQVMEGGYYNKPEETKKAIDKDEFMHTGDVGIMDDEGYVRIVDRTKDMIIVGGYKVFSTKLEDKLSEHPAIHMVATIGVPNPDRPGSEIVKAYIQIDPEYDFDGNEEALKEDITAFAKENCAPYEVPKMIEFTEEIPLTAVGKIDKKVLRK